MSVVVFPVPGGPFSIKVDFNGMRKISSCILSSIAWSLRLIPRSISLGLISSGLSFSSFHFANGSNSTSSSTNSSFSISNNIDRRESIKLFGALSKKTFVRLESQSFPSLTGFNISFS